MRGNWKKRLGVCGGLTLLCLTVVSGALVSQAGAQVVTGDFAVTGQFLGASVPPIDFSFNVNGVPQAWASNGTSHLVLPVDTTYTITPVDHPGFTVAVREDIPGVTCTNVTLDPEPAPAKFCLITFTPIVVTTTTTATTTTTTLPPTTTTGKPGQTTAHGSHTDSNRCRVHLDPNINPDANLRIGVTLASDASPQPHFGDPITLSGTTVALAIPAGLLQQGVDLALIKNGDQVPSVVTMPITGSSTTEQSHTFVIHATATIKTVPVPVSTAFPKGVKALPLNVTLALPDTHWTPVSGTADVAFAQKSLKIVSTLQLPGIGKVTVNFTCNPNTTASFVALGATGVPTTTTPVTLAPPAGSGGGGAGGATAGGLAAGGAQQLPRTGSSPWPLLVVGAVCIDLGMLAIAAAKRRRRPLHH